MKDVRWIGSSYDDIRSLPAAVRRVFGYAISEAQAGRKSRWAKPFKLGSDRVFEVVEDWSSDTYRAFYAIKIGDYVYVLHCFQKKSPRKSETPKPDLAILKARLKAAKIDAQLSESAKARGRDQ